MSGGVASIASVNPIEAESAMLTEAQRRILDESFILPSVVFKRPCEKKSERRMGVKDLVTWARQPQGIME